GQGQVIEIKTQTGEKFDKGETPEKYIDQLNFYLHTTNTQTGYLAFVNSDDPSRTRFVEVQRDEERYARTLQRVEEARSVIRGMVERREISPYETYDVLARIEVLSKVSPFSS